MYGVYICIIMSTTALPGTQHLLHCCCGLCDGVMCDIYDTRSITLVLFVQCIYSSLHQRILILAHLDYTCNTPLSGIYIYIHIYMKSITEYGEYGTYTCIYTSLLPVEYRWCWWWVQQYIHTPYICIICHMITLHGAGCCTSQVS